MHTARLHEMQQRQASPSAVADTAFGNPSGLLNSFFVRARRIFGFAAD